jgi:hypothetical protein
MGSIGADPVAQGQLREVAGLVKFHALLAARILRGNFTEIVARDLTAAMLSPKDRSCDEILNIHLSAEQSNDFGKLVMDAFSVGREQAPDTRLIYASQRNAQGRRRAIPNF